MHLLGINPQMATVQYIAVLFELNDSMYVSLVHKSTEFLKAL